MAPPLEKAGIMPVGDKTWWDKVGLNFMKNLKRGTLTKLSFEDLKFQNKLVHQADSEVAKYGIVC